MRGVEIETKYLEKQKRGGQNTDRAFEIALNRLNFPEIGEAIYVRGARGEDTLESLWVTTPSVHFDIDWSEISIFSEDQESVNADQPDIFEVNFFKDGRITSHEWWRWKLAEDGSGPSPDGLTEFWAFGRRQWLTINRAGELIWNCTTLQALQQGRTYPPAIETSWTCKAKKVDY